MIIRKKENWFSMLFVLRGSVLPQLMPRLLLLFVLASLVVYFRGILFTYKVPLDHVPLTLFGFVLALFLGFRNSASYDRFWEGRKLWGTLLIVSRSLTRQALTLGSEQSDAAKTRFLGLIAGFVIALKHQLRNSDPAEELMDRLTAEDYALVMASRYKPSFILLLMGEWVREAKQNGRIDSIEQTRFDQNLDEVSAVLGGCERIASTPIPYSYKVLLHRTVYMYCFMLPFGLVDSLKWFTPFLVVFMAYAFVAFEAIADELEDPFGLEDNDLALNKISQTIEESILELHGEDLEPRVKPTGKVHIFN